MAALPHGFGSMIEKGPARNQFRKDGLRVLLVGDDASIVDVLSTALSSAGYRVYAVGTGEEAHPTYDMWVTADDDAIFVQGGVGGYMQTWYELVSLSR